MHTFLRYAKKSVQILTIVLFALVLVCNLYLILMTRVIGVDHPTIFGCSTAVIVSGSMEPALSVDDFIVNLHQDDYKAGDIITFQNGSGLTTHRITAITENGYVTQGDANNAADAEPVPKEAVIGRVIGSIPGFGALIFFLQTPLGRLIVIFSGLILITLPFLLQRQRERSGAEAQQNENNARQ